MIRLAAVALLALIAAPTVRAGQYTWIAGLGGDWSSTNNWEGTCPPDCEYPTEQDDIAIIPGPARITLDQPITIGTLILGPGVELVGTFGLTAGVTIIEGDFTIANPRLTGGAITITASARGSGPGVLSGTQLTCHLDGGANLCDLSNIEIAVPSVSLIGSASMALHTSAAASLASLYLDNEPLGPGGPPPGSITFSGPPATFDLSSLTLFDRFSSVTFAESDVTIADVEIHPEGDNGLRDMETLLVTGAMLWDGGTVETRSGFTLASGAVATASGNVFVSGAMDVLGRLNWEANNITLNSEGGEPDAADGHLTIQNGGVLNATVISGTIKGSGSLSVHGLLNAAYVGPSPDKTIRVEPDSLHFEDATVLIVDDTILQLGQPIGRTPLAIIGSHFDVDDDATLEIASDALYSCDDDTFIGSGTLRFEDGGFQTGTYHCDADIHVDLLVGQAANGVADLSGATVVADRIEVTAGTLRLPTETRTSALVVPATVEFATGSTPLALSELHVTGTARFGGRPVTVADVFSFGLSSASLIEETPLLSLSPGVDAQWDRGTIAATEMTVEEGATLDLVVNTSVVGGTLTNHGTIRHLAGDLSISGRLVNRGRYALEATGDGIDITGAGTFENEGRFERHTSLSRPVVRAAFVNRDTLDVDEGEIEFANLGNSTTLTNEGVIVGRSGVIELPNVSDVGGTVSPGHPDDPTDWLIFPQDVTLIAGSTVEMDIGGTTAIEEYDVVNVDVDGALYGSVQVRLVDGFVPAVGDRFAVMACGNTCDAAPEALNLPDGVLGTIEVSPRLVELVITGVSVDAEAPPGETPEALPTVFALHAPAPNPSSAAVAIGYDLPVSADVHLSLHDMRGRQVAVVSEGLRPAGRHAAEVDLRPLAPGVYVARLAANDQVFVRRLTVVR